MNIRFAIFLYRTILCFHKANSIYRLFGFWFLKLVTSRNKFNIRVLHITINHTCISINTKFMRLYYAEKSSISWCDVVLCACSKTSSSKLWFIANILALSVACIVRYAVSLLWFYRLIFMKTSHLFSTQSAAVNLLEYLFIFLVNSLRIWCVCGRVTWQSGDMYTHWV